MWKNLSTRQTEHTEVIYSYDVLRYGIGSDPWKWRRKRSRDTYAASSDLCESVHAARMFVHKQSQIHNTGTSWS